MPIALPLVLLNLWKKLRAKKYRNCLPGKVVLITGSSSGLGEALAHVFYKASCKVILAARRMEELERVKKDLLALEASPITYPPTVLPLDLSELNEITKKVQGKFRSSVVLITGSSSGLGEALAHVFYKASCKVILAARRMEELERVKKDLLALEASPITYPPTVLPLDLTELNEITKKVQGKFALPHRSSYSASKHAMQAFADSLRAEVANKGVYVTCVSPGYIRTQLSVNALTGSGQTYGKMDKTTAAGMAPEDMAHKILVAILRKDKDIVICDMQAKIAYFLRFLCPTFYFWLMEKRAIKLEKADVLAEQSNKGN